MVPFTATSPSVGSITPAISLSMVLLPLPFTPISATASPLCMEKLTSFRAMNSVYRSFRCTIFTKNSFSVSVFSFSLRKHMDTFRTSMIGLMLQLLTVRCSR